MEDSPEMERDAVPPRLPKKRPAVADFKLDIPSFEDRFQDRFQFRAPNKLLPDLVAKLAVPIYFFTITSTWYLGMFEVMPVLYKDSSESALFYQRVFMVIIYLEMMLNWLCIRYVDSSYMVYLKKQWTRRRNNSAYGSGKEKDEGSLAALLEENGSACRNENGFHGTGNHPHLFQHLGNSENGATLPVAAQQLAAGNSNSSKTLPWKPPFRPPQQTTFPYWSWVPCYVCELMRPPRCHHCPLCQTCVLKRDHHCFFAGSCVGWRNQRHFLVFCCWALFGCCYASGYGVRYFLSEMWLGMRWFDLLAPVTLLRWLLGYVSGFVCFSVWVQSLLVYFILLSGTFVHEHVQLIRRGLTSFEVSSLKKTVELRDSRRWAGRFRAVLGEWWLLNLLCPLHWLFEAREDPENWPAVKVYRH